MAPIAPTPTMRRFTGQKLTGTGLYFYNSRWYQGFTNLMYMEKTFNE